MLLPLSVIPIRHLDEGHREVVKTVPHRTLNYRKLKKLGLNHSGKPWYQRRGVSLLGPPLYETTKRVLDLAISIVLLPVILAILGALSIAVRLESPGPVFFRQTRTGRGGRRFTLYKLRTMVQNAEELKEKYQHLNQKTYPDFKIPNDPRVTRVGRFLRRTSLDELPQIFNVLNGSMSLVGPRPTSFKAETYRLWQTARLTVKPGVTGLWQISGRDEVDFAERLRLDIAYIQNRSFLLDLEILLRTTTVILHGRGSH